MDKIPVNFKPRARVRLRSNVDPAIYGDFACVGNEGWVADTDEDQFGLPKVLIKWDKNHWAYNGIEDCWTFAEHFEPVEEEMDKKEQAQVLATAFANEIAKLIGEQTQAQVTPEAESMRLFAPQQEDPMQEALSEAAAHLQNCEGFLLVGVSKQDDMYAPFAMGRSRSAKAELVLQSHMAGITARSHQELAKEALHSLYENGV